MATYDFELRAIRRSLGHSATYGAAYITGQRIVDARTGLAHDFSEKQGVLGYEVVGPSHMDPSWFANQLEMRERRSNSVTARTAKVALPEELNDEQRWHILRRWAVYLWENFGLGSVIAQHAPPSDPWSSGRNHHGHQLFSTRLMDAAGFLGPKARDWDLVATSHVIVRRLRVRWADIVNQALESAGFSARVDHRSLADRGSDRLPRRYLLRGEYIAAIMGRAESRYALDNHEIIAHNEEQQQLTSLKEKIDAERDAIRRRAAQAIDAARRAVDSGKRAMANAAQRIAGAARAIRITQHAIGNYHRRECGRPPALRQRVAQALQRACDYLSVGGRDTHRRDQHRTGQQSADAADRRRDAELRQEDQRLERRTSHQGAAEEEQSSRRLNRQVLYEQAEALVDLPSLLSRHGWQIDATTDLRDHLVMIYVAQDQRIILYREPVNWRWQWFDSAAQQDGGVVDAIRELLGVRGQETIDALIQQTLQDPGATASFSSPPHDATDPLISDSVDFDHERPASDRSGQGRFASEFSLALETVRAFARRYEEDEQSNIVFPHGKHGDAEVYGQTGYSFRGIEESGLGRGRSIWYGHPLSHQPATLIFVAPFVGDALAAWQEIEDPHIQAHVVLVSTAGQISQAGVDSLKKLVRHVHGIQRVRGRADLVTLVDLNGTGVDEVAGQSETLAWLAQTLGTKHQRHTPPQGTAWSEYFRLKMAGEEQSQISGDGSTGMDGETTFQEDSHPEDDDPSQGMREDEYRHGEDGETQQSGPECSTPRPPRFPRR